MESSLLHLLLLSSLLLAIVSAVAAQGAVLDSDGDALLRGGNTTRGPFTRAAAAEGQPRQPERPRSRLLPGELHRWNHLHGRTLYIRFAAAPPCSGGRSALWQVRQSSRYVTTGGSESSAVGPHNSRFAIYRDNSARGYQIQLCPCSAGVARHPAG
ncbi:unnamed protein product [Spirodela intermedia]|uniref:Uncharacterized protein n=1 Tax=Spirodela intermedia TaxID=51605 RepID=A0A7I8IV68_SPIIN|nr:unnamed protein product [Spirodela intermedia]CAA6661463.1 unnamed protein product [Spirodela intermedia]